VQVWRSLAEVPEDLGHTVLVVGNFDGVHRGHQAVVKRAHEVAGRLELGHVVAVTFDPHPLAVLRPEHAPMNLTTVEHRVELLREAGVDDVLVVPFTRDMAAWSPERFVEEVLIETLHAAAVIVGANFRFGRQAAGDVTLLRQIGVDNEFIVEGIALDGGPMVWSSSYVRGCLTSGDVEGAAEALGRPHSVRGLVRPGDQRGRDLGWPTANVPVEPGVAAPEDGVYAGWLRVLPDGERLPAAISVGTNPTFRGRRDRRVESFVIDAPDGIDLYDQRIEVEFVGRIRGMKRFDEVEHLVAAIGDDVERARIVLGLDRLDR
jgi:riboflavin kinase / FMN adenylyltransferase